MLVSPAGRGLRECWWQNRLQEAAHVGSGSCETAVGEEAELEFAPGDAVLDNPYYNMMYGICKVNKVDIINQ